MSGVLIKKSEVVKSTIKVNDRVTFYGNLPNGDYDRYYGHDKGQIYGVVIKMSKVNAIVQCKDKSEYKVSIDNLTNIEDLF
jgi:uncharacterized Zn finger protein